MAVLRAIAGLLLFTFLYGVGIAAGFAVALAMQWTAAGEDLRLLCGSVELRPSMPDERP